MKVFKHNPPDLVDLSTIDVDGKRHYTTPDGNVYPSITTVLHKFPAPQLVAWKERVGEKEAANIARRAANRGSGLHAMCEDLLYNRPIIKPLNPLSLMLFNSIKPILTDHVDKIYGLELALYSDRLEIAGRADLIAHWDGQPALIDFKSAKKVREKASYEHYFMQAAAYSYMFFERTGIMVLYLILVFAQEYGKPIVYYEKAAPHLEKFKSLLNEYKVLTD